MASSKKGEGFFESFPALGENFEGIFDTIERAERSTVGGHVKSGGSTCLQTASQMFWMLFTGVMIIGLISALAGGQGLSGVGLLIMLATGVLAVVGVISFVRAGRTSVDKQVFPNLTAAAAATMDGVVAIEEMCKTLHARGPSEREKDMFQDLRMDFEGYDGLFFADFFMVPSSLPFVMTMGNYLFISREALENEDAPNIIAHELGHLNNGDSYARAAVWFAGRGMFGEENITAFGSVADKDEIYNQNELVRMGVDLASKNWVGLVSNAAVAAITSSGQGVKKVFDDIQSYFQHWDLQADIKALELVDPEEYLRYLEGLAIFQNAAGTPAFDAPAELRHDRIISVIDDLTYTRE